MQEQTFLILTSIKKNVFTAATKACITALKNMHRKKATPYNFDTTPDEQKTSASYPFTDDGLTEVCDYLNKFHTEHFCD